MVFPVELEESDKGLVFKLKEELLIVNAKSLGVPFDMIFEDRPHGSEDRYGGKPEERFGNFGEQLDKEIIKRGFNPEIANAYLTIGSEEEISERRTIYGNHPPIERPRIAKRKIQLYSLDKEVAINQRKFVVEFVMTWAP